MHKRFHIFRGGNRGEKHGADLASALGDIDAGREVQWTNRDKALYAQHDAGAKDLERWVLKRDKTAYAQHDHRIRILQSATREETDRACTQCACSGLPQSWLLL